MLPPEPTIRNRYRVIYAVDDRPGATVYRVRDEQTNRLMLMASLPYTAGDLEDLQLLVRQAAAVRHEVILAVLDHFAEGDRYYIVCEDVSGQDLERTLRARGEPFAEDATIGQARKLLDAIDHLHNQKPALFLGDPLPADVLVCDDGTWRLAPFTIVRPISHTPSPYRAPELDQPEAEPTSASDLFALTALLYHALTGWAPPTSAQRQAGAPLNGPRTLNPQLAPLAEQVLLRGLQMRPENRYQVPREMRLSLDMVQMMGGRSLGIGPDTVPAPAAPPPPAAPAYAAPAPPAYAAPAAPPPALSTTVPLPAQPYATGLGAPPEPKQSLRTGCLIAVALALALATIAICVALAWFIPGSPLPRLLGAGAAMPPGSATSAPASADAPAAPPAAGASAPTLVPIDLGPGAITLSSASLITQTREITGVEVGPVAYAPDGTTLAVGANNSIQLRNAATLAEFDPPRRITGHTGKVFTLAYAPDGKILASGAINENSVYLWSTADGRELRRLSDHRSWIRVVTFSPDGKTLASGSFDNTVKLWDVASGNLLHTLSGHTDFISTAAFSPDGTTLATSSADGRVLMWDVASGTQRSGFTFAPAPNLNTGVPLWATGLAFSPDGTLLAVGSEDGSIVLIDPASGANLRTLQGHSGIVVSRGLAFSPDGALLASAGFDGSVRLWNAATGAQIADLSRHGLRVLSLAFSPDGQQLASTSDQGGQLITWDVAGAAPKRSLHVGQGLITSLVFSPDSSVLGAVGYNGVIRLHLLDQDRFRVLVGSAAATNALALLPGQRIVSIAASGAVVLFEPNQDEGTPLAGFEGQALNVAASADGKLIVAGGTGGTIMRWDGDTGAAQAALVSSRLNTIYGLAISHDGTLIAAAGPPTDQRVEIWDAAHGTLLQTLSSDAAVSGLAFQPRGELLALASVDGKLSLWNARTGTPAYTIAAPRQQGRFTALAFSADGTLLLTGSPTGDLSLWDAQSGKAITTLTLAERLGIYSAGFSPDGRLLALGLGDQSVRLFGLAPGR